MNFLFYVGIIVPTVITIALFIVFIYCWLLLRARKEVLTKKYDPHGKMRSLGLSMNPPLPPTFCLLEDALLPNVGEDNVAYDVSRSPSTQQGWRGRPLYHTYHDSGISAGLSPSHEHEPRHGLAYRTCPDSGVSGLSLAQLTSATYHVTRGYCHVEEVPQRQPQLQHVYEDHDQIDTLQQQQYQQQSPHVAPHQCRVQASVHLKDGVSCSRNWNDSMELQNYDCPQTHTTTTQLGEYNLRHSNMHTPAIPTSCTPRGSMLSFYHDETEGDSYPHSGQLALCSDPGQTRDVCSDNEGSTVCTEHHISLDRVMMVSPSVHSYLKQPLTPDSTSRLYDLPLPPPPPSSLSSSTTATAAISLKQFYRNSDVMDIGQASLPGTERPDSQASQSSTTDSEDSGFRSSYCAAHRKAVLSKQEHPLLKPLRKTRRNKNHHRSSRRTAANSQNDPGGMHKPYMTRSPKHLERNIHNLSVIQQSLTGLDVMPRSLAASQPRTHITTSLTNEGDYCATTWQQHETGLAVREHSPTNSHHSTTTNSQHSTTTNFQHSTTTNSQHSTTTNSEHSTTTNSQHSTTTNFQHSTTTNSQHSTTTNFQHSTTTNFQHSTTTNSQHSTTTNSEHSPTTNSQHSPSRNIWARQSINDTEVSVRQTIDLTDISRHLGRKCLPGVTTYSRPGTHVLDEAGVLEQDRHGGPPGTARQGGADRNLNSYGYSVV